ncbi:glutathione S-transferase family protein [Novosphingobium mangrovi (ex Huang et al. 2023)]|uniref:Glutathione S-transferase family protein n=1 Tax=Novosphingobium mangrovi (ex Huang et al. 2023) TaxID=2976432 RepID=A0ABT2I818_9SPHN|nr:glutathione S-transferase family protein [Novosphingobium mangrovi (ex Huang et al. 2023)]MCT2400959.1 glutathione S-transferase family protein [Novosphingobium mangrovi (ex Huang et al. 2023)]
MADYTFYTNPMSRGQIARWALHEAGARYEQALVDWTNKSAALLAANPMGKVPTLVHHADGGDRVVTEAAAICLYLAEMHPEAELLPCDAEMADYYRWTFFAAGPVEQAITSRNLKFEPSPEQEGMAGWGSFDRTMATLDSHLAGNDWVCGSRFTMADVYVGSAVDWGLNFGVMPPLPSFVGYAERCQARAAYKSAKAVDNALIAEMRK